MIQGMILILVMHVAFAAMFPLGRAVIPHAEPIFFTGVRMLLAGTLFLTVGWKDTESKRMGLREMGLVVVASFFTMYIANVGELWALKFVPSAKAALIYSITPFCAAGISYFFLGERLSIRKLIGMAIGFFGFLFLMYQEAPSEISHGGFGIFSWGEIALIAAAFGASVGALATRHLTSVQSYSLLRVNGLAMFGAGIGALITSPLAGEQWSPVPVTGCCQFFAYLLLAILLSNIVGYGLYGMLLQSYTVTLITFAGFTQVLFAALVGWYWLGETLTWHFYLSFLFIMCGICIFYFDELRHIGDAEGGLEGSLERNHHL